MKDPHGTAIIAANLMPLQAKLLVLLEANQGATPDEIRTLAVLATNVSVAVQEALGSLIGQEKR